MKIKVINKSQNKLPNYETPNSAGMDLRADISEPYLLTPGESKLFPTGLYMAIPAGYEAQIRPRSGLALKHGITVLNTPGTIDADYRGNIGIILINHSHQAFQVNPGERIAQMVIAKCEQAELELVDSLDDTERGDGGFGHTGTN